jgi:hypothetical protein
MNKYDRYRHDMEMIIQKDIISTNHIFYFYQYDLEII